MDWLYNWVVSGGDFVLTVQSMRTPAATIFFRGVTFLGQEITWIALLTAVYWAVHRRLGRELSYLLIFVVFWNTLLKVVFGLPRPFRVDSRIIPLVQEWGYGLPSGHTMLPTALWGLAVWRRPQYRRWLLPVAVIVVGLMAFSRIYLGVHFPADILTGFGFGLLVLWLWLKIWPALARWFKTTRPGLFLGAVLLLSIALMLVYPADAAGFPAKDAVTVAGALFGLNIGFFFEERRLQFEISGSVLQKIGRYALGLVIAITFWLGLRLLFGSVTNHALSLFLRFGRYALTTCAVGWWIPALFVKVGLARRTAVQS